MEDILTVVSFGVVVLKKIELVIPKETPVSGVVNIIGINKKWTLLEVSVLTCPCNLDRIEKEISKKRNFMVFLSNIKSMNFTFAETEYVLK